MKINSVNNQYNTMPSYEKNRQNTQTISFKGGSPGKISQAVTDTLSGTYEKVSKQNWFQKGIKALSKYDSFKIIMIAESLYLSSWYLICNMIDKKIDKEQKPQMLTHDILTFGLSTAGALFADDKVSSRVNHFAEKHFAKHASYYREMGKDALQSGRDTSLKELTEQAVKTAGQTGENLKNGLSETAALIGNHLQKITGKEGKPLKTFQLTKELISGLQDEVQAAIKNAAANPESASSLKKIIPEIAGKFYELAAARAETESTMKGINKLKTLVVFGFMYRFAGSVLASPMAMKICEKFFPSQKDKTKPAGKAA